jgi:uncharacterized protein YidB (DUF937 family)
MSGLLGLLGGFGGNAGGLSNVLTQLLGNAQGAAGGGLPALLAQLENAGLGNQVKSWVGTGTNQPVTADQLAPAFSTQQVSAWAEQAGTTPDKLLQVLAQALPHTVDHLTPDGQVPSATAPQVDIASVVTRLLGRA